MKLPLLQVTGAAMLALFALTTLSSCGTAYRVDNRMDRRDDRQDFRDDRQDTRQDIREDRRDRRW